MRSIGLLVLTALILPGCDSPPPQPQQDNLINATQTDQAFPSQATGNDIITGEDATHGGAGNATGAGTAQQPQGQQQGAPAQ